MSLQWILVCWWKVFSESWFADHSHDQFYIKKKSFQWSFWFANERSFSLKNFPANLDSLIKGRVNESWFADHSHDQLCFEKKSVQWILIRKWNVFSAWPSRFSESWLANHSHDQLCIKARQHTKSLMSESSRLLAWWHSLIQNWSWETP